jgi:hypothetical protein
MKKISLLIFLLFLPSAALAYDDKESAAALMKCLIKNQKKERFTSGTRLIMACDKEHKDFLFYNQCASIGMAYCEGPVAEVIYDIMQRFPGVKP